MTEEKVKSLVIIIITVTIIIIIIIVTEPNIRWLLVPSDQLLGIKVIPLK